jgi:hypothetical protein
MNRRRKFPTIITSMVEIYSDNELAGEDEDLTWKRYERMTQKTKTLLVSATSFSTYFSIFLGSTKGRDKFLAFFQYCFEFYCGCSEYSSLEHVRQLFKYGRIPSVKLAHVLAENISQARKIFRLLKFLDEVKGMGRIIRSKKAISVKYLSIITHTFSFLYYLLDNFIWLVNVLIQAGLLGRPLEQQFKQYKNYCSFARCISYLVLLYELITKRVAKNQVKRAEVYTQSFDLF